MGSATAYHGFRLGDLDVLVVSDGVLALPARNLFGNAPDEDLGGILRRFGIYECRIPTPFNALLLRGRGRTVLVDAGYGATPAGTTGRLADNLRAALVAPEQVDAVVFSHGHADHVGGAVAADGSPLFPHARYILVREEFEFWMTDAAIEKAGDRGRQAQAKLSALRSRLDLANAGDEVLPGIRLIPAPGHTPANCMVRIEAGDATLLYAADGLAHPIHLERPDWCLEADLDPDAAIAQRRKLLDEAADAGWLVAGAHMPLPSVGRIGRGRHGTYTWTAHWQ